MRVIKSNDIILMLDYFKKEHDKTNRALIENGECKRCTKWDDADIPVKDIIDFMEYNSNKSFSDN